MVLANWKTLTICTNGIDQSKKPYPLMLMVLTNHIQGKPINDF